MEPTLCACGCGQPTRIATQNNTRDRQVKGQPLRYIKHHYKRPESPVLWIEQDCGYPTPCHVWQWCTDHKGYGRGLERQGQRTRAHRQAWIATYGPIPDGLWVLHRCDNPPCVNPDHLFLGTHADNMADMVRKGRSTLGQRNGQAKLTDEDVVAIRTATDTTQVALAARYGISQPYVSRIRSGHERAK